MSTLPIKNIIERHNKYQDSLVYSFESNLHQIVLRAQGRVIASLQSKLSITDGVIDSTAGNMRILRSAGKLFMAEMDRVGYQGLVSAFVGEFGGTLSFLRETLEYLGEQAGQDWGKSLGFTARDLSLLGGVQANTVLALESAVEAVAGQAITRGLFGVAALKFGALVETLTDRLSVSVARAQTIAESGMSVFYRTAADRAFAVITKDLPEQVLRFEYSGPADKLERPFCRHLTSAKKSCTREQIDKMDNGQFPVGSVMTTGGGWRCRHVWILSTSDLVASQAAA